MSKEELKLAIQGYMKPEWERPDFFPNPGTTDLDDERYYINDTIPTALRKLIEDFRVG